jgi:hypothetical protein
MTLAMSDRVKGVVCSAGCVDADCHSATMYTDLIQHSPVLAVVDVEVAVVAVDIVVAVIAVGRVGMVGRVKLAVEVTALVPCYIQKQPSLQKIRVGTCEQSANPDILQFLDFS